MGLDIQTYSEVTRLGDITEACRDGECGHDLHIWEQPHYAERMAPLTEGAYVGDAGPSFRAGSYGGYNWWREQLARLIGQTPDAIWSNPDAHKDTPFVELIDFSDCDGQIGPDAARELAKDFAEWEERAMEFKTDDPDADDYWRGRYKLFKEAFEQAAEGGVVVFC